MGQERLNSLSMYYHRDIDIRLEEVVEEFALGHPLLMVLVHPLNEQ